MHMRNRLPRFLGQLLLLVVLGFSGTIALHGCTTSAPTVQSSAPVSISSGSMAHSASSTASPAVTSPAIDYWTKLGLIKGHLMVANELLQANQPKQAEHN